ncbi:MAG: MFS transporter [Clostridia bacterium]|nr:MFS transporter [Clostridia bacterium]
MSTTTKAPQGAVRPFGWQDKMGYALGDMGCGFTFQLISTYMQLFYVQYIGLDNGHYWWIIIVSKLFDAINDIIIGNLVDTKRIGKKSKYMPWIIIGGLIMTVLTVAVFAPVKEFSETGKILWCLISYCLWSIAYTMVNVPYGSLHSVITDKPNERQALSTFRSIGAALPAVIIMMVLPDIVYTDKLDASGKPVIDPSTGKAEQILLGDKLLPVAIIFSVIAFFILFATTKLVKERVHRNENDSSMGAKAIFASLKTFFTNRAMVGLTIATLACVALFNSTMSLNNLVFQYFFNDVSKVKLALVVSYAPLIIVMPIIGKLTAKFGKKNLLVFTMLVSSIGGIAGLVLSYILIPKGMLNMGIYIAILLLLNVGNAIFQVSVWALVADCIALSYQKTGRSEEGSLYAIYSFFRKFAQGIGQAVVSIGLMLIGFVEGENAVQPEGIGDGIVKLYIIVLLAASVIAFLSMKFIYNIGKKEEEEMAALARAEAEAMAGTSDEVIA